MGNQLSPGRPAETKKPAGDAEAPQPDPGPAAAAASAGEKLLPAKDKVADPAAPAGDSGGGDVEAPPLRSLSGSIGTLVGAEPSSITRDPTLQDSTSAIIDRIVAAHTASNHPSVRWPTPWRTPRSKVLNSWPAFLFALCIIGMNIGVNVGVANDTSNSARVGTDFVNVFTAVLLIPLCASIFVSSLGILTKLQLLSVIGTGMVFFGTAAFYVSTVFLETTAQGWLWFAATAIISCGAFIFLATIIVVGDHIQFCGAVLLCIGMELISVGTLSSLVVTTPPGQNKFNSYNAVEAGACIVVIATAILAYKSALDVERPLLKPTNYFFHGVTSYGCGAFTFIWVAGNKLAKLYGSDYHASPEAALLASLFFLNGAMFMFLSSTRAWLHLDMCIEDRYPSTTYLTPTRLQARIFMIGSLIVLIFAFMAALGLYFALDGYIVLWIQIVAYFFIVLGMTAAALATGKQGAAGSFLLLSGLAVYFFSLVMRLYHPTVVEGFQTSIAGGGLVLSSIFGFIKPAHELRVKGIKPWALLLHPGNYFFLCFCFSVPAWGLCQVLAGIVGQGLALSSTSVLAWERLGIAFLIQGGLLALLHGQMASEVVKSTESKTQPKVHPPPLPKKPAVGELDCDVLIIGAGTAGLALANELGARHVKTVVLESRPDCISDARFLVLNGATIEGLHTLGMDVKLMESTKVMGINQDQPFGSAWVNNGLGPEAQLLACSNVPGRSEMEKARPDMTIEATARCMGSRFETQSMIRMMQSQQERVQREFAEAKEACSVRYGHELLDFEQTPDGLVVATAKPVAPSDAPSYQVRCRYLVACEGPGGIVAKKLNATFDGFINVAQTQSTLIRAPGLWQSLGERFGFSHQYHITAGGRVASFVGADHERGLWNIPVLLPRPKPTEKVEDILRGILGPNQPFEILKSKPWHMNFFIARDWVFGGNVILCGDSAHSWPPFGGIGGNTGFADAHNLGWKLALCCKGEGVAGPHLLSSYEWERKQASIRTALYVFSIMPQTKLLVRSAVLANKNVSLINRLLRLKWLYAAQELHSHNHFAQSGVQHGLRYDLSPVVVSERVLQPDDPFHLYQPRVAAGARAPNFVLGDESLLYDSIALEGFTLVVFVSSNTSRDTSQTLSNAFVKRGVPVRLVKVHPGFDSKQKGKIHQETAALYTHESLVLLRPDRYCAWHLGWGLDLSPEEANIVVSKVCGWLAPPSESDAMATWLERKFLHVVEPLTNTFPNAVRVVGETKDAALEKLRNTKGVQGIVTTKNQ